MWMKKTERVAGGGPAFDPPAPHLQYKVRKDGTLKFHQRPRALPGKRDPRLATTGAQSAPLVQPNIMQQLTPESIYKTSAMSASMQSPAGKASASRMVVDESPIPIDEEMMEMKSNRSASKLSRGAEGPETSGRLSQMTSFSQQQHASEARSMLKKDSELLGLFNEGPSSSSAAERSPTALAARIKIPDQHLASRESALIVQNNMMQRLQGLEAEHDLPRTEHVLRAHGILNDVVHEVVRQVSVQCADRGKLLARVWLWSTDLLNTFASMFLAETERHKEDEARTQAALKTARHDYLSVVKKMEELVKDTHMMHEALTEANVKAEEQHRKVVGELKEDLYRANARVRRLQQLCTTNGIQMDSTASPAKAAKKKLKIAEEESDLVRDLRNQLQQQKLALVDAAREIARLEEKDYMVNAGTNTVPPELADRAVSPVMELLVQESDSDDELADAPATTSPARGPLNRSGSNMSSVRLSRASSAGGRAAMDRSASPTRLSPIGSMATAEIVPKVYSTSMPS